MSINESSLLELAAYGPQVHHQWRASDRVISVSNRLSAWPEEVSRVQIEILEWPITVRVTNFGEPIKILGQKNLLESGADVAVRLPLRWQSGQTWLEAVAGDSPESWESRVVVVERPTLSGVSTAREKNWSSLAAGTLRDWFEALAQMQRAAASSSEFFRDAARLICEPGGLDMGLIMFCDRDGHWETRACDIRDPQHGIVFPQSFLEFVRHRGNTYFQNRYQRSGLHGNVEGTFDSAFAGAPIMDVHQQVMGVVCGVRHISAGSNRRRGVRPLEARWLELLAETVGAGVARLQAEADAVRHRVRLEQVFSPEIVRELERCPRILQGQQREITVLFSDLRGFSAIAQRLGPRDTYRLMEHVMDQWTAAVTDQGGVVIDYYGDGLAAMWNAPADQSNHVERACRAALAMQSGLPNIDAIWLSVVREPLRLGIGIHTGEAWVGNAGSHTRIKYGPRGSTVNIVSRVERATKLLDATILLTGVTQQHLNASAVTRRVCRARFSGIDQPYDLYELYSLERDQSTESLWRWIEEYERGLDLFETGQIDEAYCVVEPLLDISEVVSRQCASAAQFLLARAHAFRRQQPGRRSSDATQEKLLDPIVDLTG